MTIVIDDRLLLDGLAGRAPALVAAALEDGSAFTTSSWYYRLGRAVFAGSGTASLSGRLAGLPPSTLQRVQGELEHLPESIGLLHPKVVVPVMFTLRVGRPVNLLTAEALAVAALLDASLAVTTDAALLRDGAARLGIAYLIVP